MLTIYLFFKMFFKTVESYFLVELRYLQQKKICFELFSPTKRLIRIDFSVLKR